MDPPASPPLPAPPPLPPPVSTQAESISSSSGSGATKTTRPRRATTAGSSPVATTTTTGVHGSRGRGVSQDGDDLPSTTETGTMLSSSSSGLPKRESRIWLTLARESDDRCKSRAYELVIRQAPTRARLCSFKEEGSSTDRRPVDPPPIIQILSNEPGDQTEFLEATSLFVRATLVSATPGVHHDTSGEVVAMADGSSSSSSSQQSANEFVDGWGSQRGKENARGPAPEDYEIVKTPAGTEATSGEVVMTPEKLKDLDDTFGSFCVFANLSVRLPGIFRFRMTLYEMLSSHVCKMGSVVTEPFEVFSPKRFTGMAPSTALTRHFADQGLKIKLRQGQKGPAVDSGQPRQRTPPTPPVLKRPKTWSGPYLDGMLIDQRDVPGASDSELSIPTTPSSTPAGRLALPAIPYPELHPYESHIRPNLTSRTSSTRLPPISSLAGFSLSPATSNQRTISPSLPTLPPPLQSPPLHDSLIRRAYSYGPSVAASSAPSASYPVPLVSSSATAVSTSSYPPPPPPHPHQLHPTPHYLDIPPYHYPQHSPSLQVYPPLSAGAQGYLPPFSSMYASGGGRGMSVPAPLDPSRPWLDHRPSSSVRETPTASSSGAELPDGTSGGDGGGGSQNSSSVASQASHQPRGRITSSPSLPPAEAIASPLPSDAEVSHERAPWPVPDLLSFQAAGRQVPSSSNSVPPSSSTSPSTPRHPRLPPSPMTHPSYHVSAAPAPYYHPPAPLPPPQSYSSLHYRPPPPHQPLSLPLQQHQHVAWHAEATSPPPPHPPPRLWEEGKDVVDGAVVDGAKWKGVVDGAKGKSVVDGAVVDGAKWKGVVDGAKGKGVMDGVKWRGNVTSEEERGELEEFELRRTG